MTGTLKDFALRVILSFFGPGRDPWDPLLYLPSIKNKIK